MEDEIEGGEERGGRLEASSGISRKKNKGMCTMVNESERESVCVQEKGKGKYR